MGFCTVPFTDNIAVSKHGNTFVLTFQGSQRNVKLDAVNGAGLLGGTLDVATRVEGVNYYGVGTLNVNLGSGADTANVRGTSAVTNLSTGAGDDTISVASPSETLQSSDEVASVTSAARRAIRSALRAASLPAVSARPASSRAEATAVVPWARPFSGAKASRNTKQPIASGICSATPETTAPP